MTKTADKHKEVAVEEKAAPKNVAKPAAIENAPQLNEYSQAVVKHCVELGIPKDIVVKVIQKHPENASILRQLK